MNILNLQKNDVLDLNKVDDTLKIVDVGLGWDTHMDLDSIAFLIDNDNKVVETAYYGALKKSGVELNGDNRTGEGFGDDEIITIKFAQVPSNITTIALYVNIYGADGWFRKKDFSKVKGAYVRLVNRETGKEVCKYSLTEDGKGFNAFHFADLTRTPTGWSFRAIGQGCNGSVVELKSRYK